MKKRFLTLLLAFSLLLSSTSVVFANENVNIGTKIGKTESKYVPDGNAEKSYIVVLKDDSNVDFASLSMPEGKKSRESKSKVLLDSFKAELKKADISYETLYEYDLLFAGIALKTKVKNIKAIEKMALVESVEISNEFSKPTVKESGQEFVSKRRKRSIDSNNLMKVTDELRKKYNGQGRVVAVLDTGLDVDHEILRVTDVSKGKYPTKDSMEKKMQEVGINYGSWRNNKVVYAHNYDTNGTNVKETIKEDSHGMHVSGISVGNPKEEKEFNDENGNSKKERIIGTAPEAQLIFMGVFQGETTFSHMYAKAVEDSVKLGADSINLSLGAANGSIASVGKAMDKAISFARKMGVIVAIAAGNDGHFGAFTEKPPVTNPDYGTVGSPAVAKDSLAVAAMNTTVERIRTITIEGVDGLIRTADFIKGVDDKGDLDENKDFIAPGQAEQTYDMVEVGLGNEESDYANKEVKDKIVVVKRGVKSFADKIILAEKHGAKGVIIYNHEQGGDDIMLMDFGQQRPQVKIPSVFVGNKSGELLKTNINKKVKFVRQLTVVPYAKGGELTDFSSYGWASDGTFKPDITAPGGLIYSSINNNNYMSMNGTSMATPHVAGAVTLVRESLNKRHPEITGEKEYDILKAMMMSTADPVKEKGTENYVSPRKQGAGAINVEKATSSEIYVVDGKDNPKVWLHDVDSKFDINLKVVNIGKETKTLKYKTVLGTDATENGRFALKTKTLDTIEGKEITVKGGETVNVTITVDASSFDAQLIKEMPNGYFLEGFVFFHDAKDGGKEISIPFSGFKGKWADLTLWEKPVYDFNIKNKELPIYTMQENVFTGNFTSLVTIENNPFARAKQWEDNGQMYNFVGNMGEIPLGFNVRNFEFSKDNLAISPNGDNNKDFAMFKGVFFRNSQYVRVEVFNENNELVYKNGSGYGAKNSNNYNPKVPKSTFIEATYWNGMVNNKPLPEGKYKYVVMANSEVGGQAMTDQKLEFEVKLDVTAPKIATPKVEGNIYKPEITDNLSGVEETVLRYIDSDGKMCWIESNADGNFEVPNGIDHKNIYIHTFDYAGNMASLNLDGSEYVDPQFVPQDLGANIKPIFRVTNYKDFEGKHIEGSEKLNMFPIEINWREKVGINVEGKAWYEMGKFSYINELVNISPGTHQISISEIPDVYEPLKENTKTVTVEQGKIAEVVFETRQKEEVIEKGYGEVNIRLQINDYPDNYMGPGASYVIKDKDGKVLESDSIKKYTKLYESPAVDQKGNILRDDQGNLKGINFHRDIMTVLPVGEYTVELTTMDDILKFETTSIKFTVEENKPKRVIFKAQEMIKDVVNIGFEGLDELPEGVKVTLVNADSKEEVKLEQSKFNKKVFYVDVVNGKYNVKVEVPEGYAVDRDAFEITVSNDKVREIVKIKKAVKLTDKTKKVSVSGYHVSEDWTLKAELKDKNKVEKLKDLDVDLYDIYFVDKMGKKVTVPKGEYKVSIAKTKGKTADDIFYVNEKGELESLKGTMTQDDKNVMFTTKHFSEYAVSYGKEEPKKTEEDKKPEDNDQNGGKPQDGGKSQDDGKPQDGGKDSGEQDKLKKTNVDTNVLSFVVLAVASLAIALVVNKKRTNK